MKPNETPEECRARNLKRREEQREEARLKEKAARLQLLKDAAARIDERNKIEKGLSEIKAKQIKHAASEISKILFPKPKRVRKKPEPKPSLSGVPMIPFAYPAVRDSKIVKFDPRHPEIWYGNTGDNK